MDQRGRRAGAEQSGEEGEETPRAAVIQVDALGEAESFAGRVGSGERQRRRSQQRSAQQPDTEELLRRLARDRFARAASAAVAMSVRPAA